MADEINSLDVPAECDGDCCSCPIKDSCLEPAVEQLLAYDDNDEWYED